MSKVKKTLIILFFALGFTSCEVLNQMAQMASFANCSFNFNSVDQIQMLGINLRKGMSRKTGHLCHLVEHFAGSKSQSEEQNDEGFLYFRHIL